MTARELTVAVGSSISNRLSVNSGVGATILSVDRDVGHSVELGLGDPLLHEVRVDRRNDIECRVLGRVESGDYKCAKREE